MDISFKNIVPLVILDMLEAIGTSRALAIAICLRNKAINYNSELLDTMSHLHYQCEQDYFNDAQACALLKKSLFLNEGIDSTSVLEKRALESFLEVELEVKSFEERRLSLCGPEKFRYHSLINRAAIIAESILGRFPTDNFSTIDLAFTGGSTSTLSGLNANVVDKIQSDLYVSPSCAHFLMTQINNCSLLKENWASLKACKHNVFKTVPKDFRKRRIVCPEPLGNMFLQRGIASFLRKRLLKVGIDIGHQADLHRDLLATMPEIFSTIDQSDASDRISRQLVKDIIPSDWFDVLDKCRSKYTLIGDNLHTLSKFMTQGNGFTFELETLLFYCISKAAIDNKFPDGESFVSIFGDDTIVYDHHGKTVIDALVLCGLKINYEKSYVNTHFKESCGFDTFNGVSVRPIYFKDFSHGIYGLYELANRISAVARLYGGNVFCHRAFLRAFRRVENAIPKHQRFYGPSLFGDTVLYDDTGRLWAKRSKDQCNYIRTLGTKYVKIGRFKRVPTTDTGTLIYALCGYDSQGTLIRGAPRVCKPIWCTLREEGTGIGWL